MDSKLHIKDGDTHRDPTGLASAFWRLKDPEWNRKGRVIKTHTFKIKQREKWDQQRKGTKKEKHIRISNKIIFYCKDYEEEMTQIFSWAELIRIYVSGLHIIIIIIIMKFLIWKGLKVMRGQTWESVETVSWPALSVSQCWPQTLSRETDYYQHLRADGSSLDPWRLCLSIPRSQQLYEYNAVIVTNKMMWIGRGAMNRI